MAGLRLSMNPSGVCASRIFSHVLVLMPTGQAWNLAREMRVFSDRTLTLGRPAACLDSLRCHESLKALKSLVPILDCTRGILFFDSSYVPGS